MLDAGFYNLDCMDGMAQFPDKFFSLAIVDPPYGIGAASQSFGFSQRSRMERKEWDSESPDPKYFMELFRVSKNQIIWGSTNFELPARRGFIVWDKGEGFYNRDFAECELAWFSFDKNARIYKRNPLANGDYVGRIHPTQKPIALYKWLLSNYAKPGDKILDTHVGSASSLIACHQMGFEYWGFELDTDYYNAATERLNKVKAQVDIFEACELPKPEQVSMINSYQKLP